MNKDEKKSQTEKFLKQNDNNDVEKRGRKDDDELAKRKGEKGEREKGEKGEGEKGEKGEGEGAPESWLKKLKKELRPDKKLIPLKVLAFLFYGGMFAMTPFYALHMQQLGLSVTEVAIVYSALPLPAIVGPVISGLVADWSARYKEVLVANIVLSVVSHLATVYIPPLPAGTDHLAVGVMFNSSGYAVARPDCFQEGDAGHPGMMEPWSCNSNCFSDSVLAQLLNGTTNLHCSDYEVSREIPLRDCIVPMADDPDCGYGLSFLPQERDVASVKLQRTSLHYSEQQCSLTCNKTAARISSENEGFSNSNTFWIYFVLRIIGTMFMKASFSMMDASIMAVMLKSGGDYGKQRLVAMLSMATFPFIASCLVIQRDVGVDYSPVFYLSTCLLTACVAVSYFIAIKGDDSTEGKKDLMKNMAELFKRMEVDVFLFVIFLLGANWGFLENFLFVYLKQLNAPTYLLGLTLTFGCLTGVPMLLVSDRIVEWLGRQKIFFIGFLAYTVRMFGYSIITNPWYCFIFESLEVFTYQIMWVAAVTYFPILAPTSLLGTLSGIAGAVHYNIGRGGGAFIGGFLISHIGMIWTFRVFGIASFVFAFLYIALQKLYLNDALAKKDLATADNNSNKMAA